MSTNVSRLLTPPNQSFFLFGPRGSGKSTWLRQVFSSAYVIDLLSEDTYQRLLADPSLFAAELRPLASDRWVIIDEIQRLPNLLNEVHRLIEERRQPFVLCASSTRKLNRAGVNLLGGRALRRAMHPFVPEELGNTFDLATALRHGLLPIVWDAADREETLSAYARMYLREEVQAEALVRNLPGYARFLPAAALCHGQTVNVTNIARESGVARTTVEGYLQILEDTLLCFRVPAFEARLRARERRLPKLYWCDPGIVRSMKRARGEPVEEERGALFEGLVAQILRAYMDYRDLCDDICYWASHGSATIEVDFLLRRDGEHIAIEAKAGRRFVSSWCKGLRAMAPLEGLRRRLIVYAGDVALCTEDGIDVLPFADFAGTLTDGDLWRHV